MAYLFPRSEANLPPPPTPEELRKGLAECLGRKEDRGYVQIVNPEKPATSAWRFVLGTEIKKLPDDVYTDVIRDVIKFADNVNSHYSYVEERQSAEIEINDSGVAVTFRGPAAKLLADDMHEMFGHTIVNGFDNDEVYKNIVKYFSGDRGNLPDEIQRIVSERMITIPSFANTPDSQFAKVVLIGTPDDRAVVQSFLKSSPLADETPSGAAAGAGAAAPSDQASLRTRLEVEYKEKYTDPIDAVRDEVSPDDFRRFGREFQNLDEELEAEIGRVQEIEEDTPDDEAIRRYQAVLTPDKIRTALSFFPGALEERERAEETEDDATFVEGDKDEPGPFGGVAYTQIMRHFYKTPLDPFPAEVQVHLDEVSSDVVPDPGEVTDESELSNVELIILGPKSDRDAIEWYITTGMPEYGKRPPEELKQNADNSWSVTVPGKLAELDYDAFVAMTAAFKDLAENYKERFRLSLKLSQSEYGMPVATFTGDDAFNAANLLFILFEPRQNSSYVEPFADSFNAVMQALTEDLKEVPADTFRTERKPLVEFKTDQDTGRIAYTVYPMGHGEQTDLLSWIEASAGYVNAEQAPSNIAFRKSHPAIEAAAKASFQNALKDLEASIQRDLSSKGPEVVAEFNTFWKATDEGKAVAEATSALKTPGEAMNVVKYWKGVQATKAYLPIVAEFLDQREETRDSSAIKQMEMLKAEIAEIKTSLEGMGVTKEVTSFTFKDLPAIPPLPPRREEPWSTDAIDWLLKRRYLTTKEKLRSDVSIYSTGRLGEYDQGSSFTDVERESTGKGRKMRPLIISILTGEVPEGATLSILSGNDLYFLRQYLDNIRKVLKDKRLSSIKIDEDTPVVTIRLLLADIYDALKYEERQFITALSNLYWLHLSPKELELREELNV